MPDDPRTAGLYHTAFLQPTRADLARWLVHAARNRVALTGASDHLVSEAIYLDDPEGNGIEVYRDRLPEEWRWNGDRIQMATERLDLDKLAADAGNTAYAGAPAGLRIGHIHLRVGDLDTARKFYSDIVGLDPTAGRGGALFMSSGRYHHHVGSNIWHSAGAGMRDDDRAGLSWFAIEAANEAEREAALARLKAANVPLGGSAQGPEARDPYGTRVRFST
jgi:catechol 2,3-dioxygenase